MVATAQLVTRQRIIRERLAPCHLCGGTGTVALSYGVFIRIDHEHAQGKPTQACPECHGKGETWENIGGYQVPEGSAVIDRARFERLQWAASRYFHEYKDILEPGDLDPLP